MSGCVACGAMRPWHAAARSSAGCAGCAGVCGRYLCASSPLDAIPAPPAASKPSAVVEGRSSFARSSAVWNGSLHFDRALWSLHGPLARGGTVLTRCTPGVHREPPESEIREELGRSGLSACDELYYDANHKTAYVRVGCALRHIPRLLRHITKLRPFGLALGPYCLQLCSKSRNSYSMQDERRAADAKMRNRADFHNIGRASRRYRVAAANLHTSHA